MVKIGVLTNDGRMFLIDAPKINATKMDSGEIEEKLESFLEDSASNFNWQILDEVQMPGGWELSLRIERMD